MIITITSKQINEILNIKENYELPKMLLHLMLSEEKNSILEKFLEINNDLNNDYFRDYFQEAQANRSDLKQDYTPDCLCNLISKLQNKGTRILDCCSGTGSLILQTSKVQKDMFYQCEELSKAVLPVLLFNLSIRNISALVVNSNVLTRDIDGVYKVSSREKFSDIEEIESFEENKFDVIISNPPYSLNWEAKRDERFEGYELAPKSKADYAFVLDMLYRLSDKGEAFIILPTGVLFRGGSESQIRQKLIENNLIDSIIVLPNNLFLNTQIPVLIMVLKKNKHNSSVLFIDASKEFVKKGKQNILTEQTINKIVDTFKNRKEIDKYSHIATFEELKKNDFNLNIPRYVDTFDKSLNDTRPVSEIMNELIDLEKEYHDNLMNLSTMIQELEGTTIEASKQVEDLKLKYKVLETFDNEGAYKNFTETLEKISQDVEKAQKTQINLGKIATIERAIKNKVYKKGCVLLQISATHGQLLYLSEDKEVEAKYAVIIPNPDVNSRYLYYSISGNLERYLSKVQQDINIALEDVYKIPVIYYIDPLIQNKIVLILESFSGLERNSKKDKEVTEEEKKFLLKNMFV